VQRPGIERQAAPLMGTIVTIDVVTHDAAVPSDRAEAVARAFSWFREVESRCTRFDPASELMQLCAHVGTPVPASPILYEAVRFALAVAEDTQGAFDPAVGHQMESRGFNREHHTGTIVTTSIAAGEPATHRDVYLDPDARTITLGRPLVLDLGAVAKGLAIDLAAHELRPLRHFAVDAGGDLYLGGLNPRGEPWAVGIRHPRHDDALIDRVIVSDRAVCTSGDYERRGAPGVGGHHILDPKTGASASVLASVTVVAATAMLADALATAAFVMGPEAGLSLIERHGADGLLISPTLDCYATRGLNRDHTRGPAPAVPADSAAAILPNA
jgi:FAD:protein FMN transferase